MTYTNCDLILSVKDAEDHEKWLKTRDLGIGGSDNLQPGQRIIIR